MKFDVTNQYYIYVIHYEENPPCQLCNVSMSEENQYPPPPPPPNFLFSAE